MKRTIKFSPKSRLIAALIVVCVAVGLALLGAKWNSDNDVPEISYPSTKMKLGIHKAEQLNKGNYRCLLKDVTAVDETDGDISSRVIVKACRISKDNKYAVVTYQVADRSANYAYTRRIVYFRKEVYEPPEVHPVYKLTTERIETKVGQRPNIEEYIEELSDDTDTYETLRDNAVFKGDANIYLPGEYKMTTYTVDQDGNKSEKIHFTLVVQ